MNLWLTDVRTELKDVLQKGYGFEISGLRSSAVEAFNGMVNGIGC
jgi:hypothetical protein